MVPFPDDTLCRRTARGAAAASRQEAASLKISAGGMEPLCSATVGGSTRDERTNPARPEDNRRRGNGCGLDADRITDPIAGRRNPHWRGESPGSAGQKLEAKRIGYKVMILPPALRETPALDAETRQGDGDVTSPKNSRKASREEGLVKVTFKPERNAWIRRLQGKTLVSLKIARKMRESWSQKGEKCPRLCRLSVMAKPATWIFLHFIASIDADFPDSASSAGAS